MKQGQCRVCGHQVILHVAEVADVIGDWTDGEAPAGQASRNTDFLSSLPWRLARLPGEEGRPRSDITGLVEAYICKQCGYTEFYTRHPEGIPIDGRYVREIKPTGGGAPYR